MRLHSRQAFVVSLAFLCSGAAAASNLYGHVLGDGEPLPNVVLTASPHGSGTIAGTATTDTNGSYSIALQSADGPYDLAIAPPAGDGFGSETIQVSVSGDTDQEIVLVSKAVVVSGTVTGLNGAPVGGGAVHGYWLDPTNTYEDIGTLSIDASGNYSFPARAGTLYFEFWNYAQGCTGSPCVQTAPVQWFKSIIVQALQSTVLDISLPVFTVHGQVTDPDGLPVQGATVQVNASTEDTTTYPNLQVASSQSAVSDSTGAYSLFVFPGAAQFFLSPPSGVTYGVFQTLDVTLTGDAEQDLQFPPAPATITVSGTMRGLAGVPVPGGSINVYLYSAAQGGNLLQGSTVINSDGTYSAVTPPGMITLGLSGYDQLCVTEPCVKIVPHEWELNETLTTAQSVVHDIQLPVIEISGTLTGYDGNLAPGTTIEGYVSQSVSPDDVNGNPIDPGETYATVYNEQTPAADGTWSMLLIAGPAEFVLTPPAGSDNAKQVIPSTPVVDGTFESFVLPEGVVISGVVTAYGGKPVYGGAVGYYYYDPVYSYQYYGQVPIDDSGNYSLTTRGGQNYLYFFNYGQSCSPSPCTLTAPQEWAETIVLPFLQSQTLNVQLPVIQITGKVTDSNHAPVPGVYVYASINAAGTTGDPYSLAADHYAYSDASGNYSLLSFAGPVGYTVMPASGSGFAQLTLSPVVVTTDILQTIILQRPRTAPPAIVSGPTVIHLSNTSVSINWVTDEASDSTVQYDLPGGTRQTIAQPQLVTQHSVTLLGLTPEQTYSYTVSSTDAYQNGPTTSPVSTFETNLLPDTTPPVFLSGPTALPDATSAAIIWTTDEPAAGVVEWGTTSALASSTDEPAGLFPTSHEIQLNGLVPSTTYYFEAFATDPSGNQSSSSVLSFTTLATPAESAPLISSGPTALAITANSITIAWTTNEPSNSGVSYNDGTVYNLLQDATLVEQHQITVAGLTAATPYYFTVSSTDAFGNGPVLSSPLTAVTLSAPDTTKPVISNVVIGNVTTTSATVSWTTNKPSTSALFYGPTAAVSGGTIADLTLTTSHSLLLTGLVPGSTTWVQVDSTDASGNVATPGTPQSFVALLPPPPAPFVNGATDGLVTSQTVTIGFGATPTSATATATLNGAAFTSGSAVSAEGNYTLVVTAADTYGQTASVTLNFAIDRTAPVIAFTGISNGEITDHIVVPGFLVTDAHPGSATATLDGLPFTAGAVVSAAGPHLLSVTAADLAGNSSVASASFTLDFIPPSIVISGVSNGAIYQTAVTPIVSVSDPIAVTAEITLDGSTFLSGAQVGTQGVHTLSVLATDAAGNTASQMVQFTVQSINYSLSFSQTGQFRRVLALLRQEGCAPDQSRLQDWTAFLNELSSAGGGLVAIDTSDSEFLEHLRSGLYNIFVLIDLSADDQRGANDRDQQPGCGLCNGWPLEWTWIPELTELVWSGSAGVIAARTSVDGLAGMEPVFGTSVSSACSESSVGFTSAPLGPLNLKPAGEELSFRTTSGTASARYGSGSIGAVSNTYGAGRSIELGFDPTLASPSTAAVQLLSRAVAWVTPAAGIVEPLSVQPIALAVDNTGPFTEQTRVKESLDSALAPLASTPSTPYASGAFTWNFSLAAGATSSLDTLVRVPDLTGSYSIAATASALNASGASIGGSSQTFSLTVSADGAELLTTAIAAASALPRSGFDSLICASVLADLEWLQQKRGSSREGLDEEIGLLLVADAELQTTRADSSRARSAIDALLRYAEALWSIEPAACGRTPGH